MVRIFRLRVRRATLNVNAKLPASFYIFATPLKLKKINKCFNDFLDMRVVVLIGTRPLSLVESSRKCKKVAGNFVMFCFI